MPLGEQPEHRDLALGEPGEGQTAWMQHLALEPPDLGQEPAQEVRRERPLPGRRRADRDREVAAGHLATPDDAAHARLDRRQQADVIDLGDEQDQALVAGRPEPAQLAGRLLVDLVRDDHHDGGRCRGRVRDHVDAGLVAQVRGKAGPG